MAAMKPSLRKTPAPSPRLTLWGPAGVAAVLCLAWLVLLALIRL